MPGTDPAIEQQLAALRSDYVHRLEDKLHAIERQAGLLEAGSGQSENLEQLHRLTHRLAGSAGTFGCPEVSSAARYYDNLLRQLMSRPSLCPDDLDEIASRSHALRAVIYTTSTRGAGGFVANDDRGGGNDENTDCR